MQFRFLTVVARIIAPKVHQCWATLEPGLTRYLSICKVHGDMSSHAQKIGLGVVATLCVALSDWILIARVFGDGSEANAGTGTLVACSNERCGFTGEMDPTTFVYPKNAGPVVSMPGRGPGFVCPKCSQNTLYTSATRCAKCANVYLPVPNSETSSRCPKCGAEP